MSLSPNQFFSFSPVGQSSDEMLYQLHIIQLLEESFSIQEVGSGDTCIKYNPHPIKYWCQMYSIIPCMDAFILIDRSLHQIRTLLYTVKILVAIA